jgi:hypothetical protein
MDRVPGILTAFAFALTLVSPLTATAEGSDITATLEALSKTTSADERTQLAEDLAKSSRDHVEALAKYLGRTRTSTDGDRRAVLGKIDADVPDKTGKFRTPKRMTKEERARRDNLDWLANLIKLKAKKPVYGEVIADVATIRALAASRQVAAGAAILDFAFTEVGLIYRDECGRYLRKMSPYSLPAIIRASQKRKENASLARYANYQLERLDRQNANKALADTNDTLKLAILEAYKDSLYREAVYAVLDHVNHINPKVRAAARAAWIEYATGREPRPAPKRRLVEPGGRLSDKKQPLWLNHRELADIEVRKVLTTLTGKEPAESETLKALSESLFEYYDSQRKNKLDKTFEAAMKSASEGRDADTIDSLDSILGESPNYPRKKEMADAYFVAGKAVQKSEDWKRAAAAFAKAHALDPEGKNAKEALAAHHYSRGKARKAEAGGGAAEIARAKEIDPGAGSSDKVGDESSSTWMLYGGVVWLVGGVLLLIIGIQVRRRRR